MVKVISTIKAVLTRIIFSVHSFIAVWQVNQYKQNHIYWALCGPIGLLILEGVFTLAIKKNQEWRWFCPSVFLYLGSVVPAIWLLELEKINVRLAITENRLMNNQTSLLQPNLHQLFGDNIKIPTVDAQTWTTLIEQFLMLILIIGRWMLPKGDLTRDQLSQLLLVYIGTAADIIEFFDSYKDDAIAKIPLLVYLTLGIWSWSLIQFTIVLSATRARKPRGGGTSTQDEGADCCNDCCCGIDVWGIALNVLLQDAPFLTFRLLIIIHFRIINYMNVFFTCKNSLVILLQLYRLYVVNAEYWSAKSEFKRRSKYGDNREKFKRRREEEKDMRSQEIYIISEKPEKKKIKKVKDDYEEDFSRKNKYKKDKDKYKRRRKDTGYSTGSSQNAACSKKRSDKSKCRKKDKKHRKKSNSSDSDSSREDKRRKRRYDEKKKHRKTKHFDPVVEESFDSSDSSIRYEMINEKHSKKKKRRKSSSSTSSSSSSSSS